MRSLVDIGLRKLEVSITGEGQPIVILPGLASSMDEWEGITKQLSTHAQVIVFHRAGCGESELGDEKRNSLATVKDLELLLNKLQIKQPVIVIGHSYGGLCAQRFVLEYPEKVRSVVLVESNSADFELLNEVIGPQTAQWSAMYRAFADMNAEQIKEKGKPHLAPELQLFSEEARERMIAFKTNPRMYRALADELEEMPHCAKQLKQYGGFSPIPLLVIGRDPEHSIQTMIRQGMPEEQAVKIEAVWQDLIKGQLNLSTTSQYVMAEQSGHGVYVDNPAVIVNAITSIVT